MLEGLYAAKTACNSLISLTFSFLALSTTIWHYQTFFSPGGVICTAFSDILIKSIFDLRAALNTENSNSFSACVKNIPATLGCPPDLAQSVCQLQHFVTFHKLIRWGKYSAVEKTMMLPEMFRRLCFPNQRIVFLSTCCTEWKWC